MHYSVTFTEDQYTQLVSHLFGKSEGKECAAYLLCGISQTTSKTRLLVRQVIPIPNSQLIAQSGVGFTIPSSSFLPVLKLADQQSACFALVHSHPGGIPDHSQQDDREERKLFATAYNRIAGLDKVHASIVLSSPTMPRGRVWLDGGMTAPIELVRVTGRRFRFFFRDQQSRVDASFYDRQVRAFGPDLLPVLRSLTVGVVGAGGTGSSVVEQLIRLGIGRLVIADGDSLDRSNISRVYGSAVDDVNVPKSDLMSKLAQRIGLGTVAQSISKPITYESVLKRFRDCDVIFGCTDDEWGRSLLCQFAIRYSVPVFDLGAKIDSKDGIVRAIVGRVTILMPGTRCLFCRGHISVEGVSADIAQVLSPGEAANLRREGYIRELPGVEPSVIAFTTATAAFAIAEFLDRIAGYRADARASGEISIRFDELTIRKPGPTSLSPCFCTDASLIGRGDQQRFLDQTWRPE
jgi:proteasome lid subunit RPN8/RPN11